MRAVRPARCGAVALAALLATFASHGAEQSMNPFPTDAYRLQPGDVLSVSVWKEPDLQADVLVRSDGGISFALAGDIPAAGMSFEELRAEIAARLSKYIPDPVVTVAPKLLGGNRVYVIGKVNRPGEFQYIRPLDVMQAISLAGGATPFASVDGIHILRRTTGGRQEAIPFRYSEVERGRSLEQNIILKSGDTVVVP
jgi:polysaccharide biosynthesis/export protein